MGDDFPFQSPERLQEFTGAKDILFSKSIKPSRSRGESAFVMVLENVSPHMCAFTFHNAEIYEADFIKIIPLESDVAEIFEVEKEIGCLKINESLIFYRSILN